MADQGQAPRALRLTFSYEGDKIQLVSQQSVEMTAPPSDPLQGGDQQQLGFWYELKGEGAETVYRRVIHNPIPTSVEVFSNDPTQTIHRAPADKRSGVFSLVVPDLKEARFLSLSSSPPETPGLRQAEESLAAVEIARFDLKEK